MKPAVTCLLTAIGVMLIYLIARVQDWDTLVWASLFCFCLDVREDEVAVEPVRFLPAGLVLLALLYFIYRNADGWWWRAVAWQLKLLPHKVWNWDWLFPRIPFNDPIFVRRLFDHPWLVKRFKWVYGYGFAFCVWAGVIRSFLARNWRKMIQYALSAQFLQTVLIVPVYNLVTLHESWWVMGRPDAWNRPASLAPQQVAVSALFAFPSMHTSVAFAVMLLALREKGMLYRWGMSAYSAGIIFSTLYLDIHWTIDVLAGLGFGYAAVRLSDWCMALLGRFRWPRRRRQAPAVPGAVESTVEMPG